MLSYVANQEPKKIFKRQADGSAEVRKAGKHLGRPRLDLAALSKEQRKELTGVKFAEMLGLNKHSFYKVLRDYEFESKNNS